MNTKIKFLGLVLAGAMLGATLVACGDNASDTNSEIPVYSQGLDENGYFEGVKALDYVTLPEYKGIDVTRDLIEASEEDLEKQLADILAQYDSYVEITDPEVLIKDGDTVNIDYVGYIDGIEFDGGNTGGLGTNVTIGVTNYIDDFLEQLIGHAAGEKFDIEVTFPEDYGNEELNGQDATFSITINHIHGDVIKAELTDEIAADYGFATADELIEDVKEWLVNSARFYFFTDILGKAEVSEVPQAALDYIINLDIFNLEYYATMHGVSVEDYLTSYYSVDSKEAYIESNMESYTSDAKLYLAAQAIAEAENLTVSDEEITEAGYAEYVEEMGKPYIKQYMLFQEIIPTFIAENGNVGESLDTEDTAEKE